MAFQVDTIDLSMRDPSTGRFRTANIYTIDGVVNEDNSPRVLSIGQLVMAICLQRAAQLEASIISLMDDMNTTSAKLEKMTDIENTLLNYGCYMNDTTKNGVVWEGTQYTCRDFLVNIVGMDASSVTEDHVTPASTDFIASLESKMDELNTFNQEKMIELQSLTNKRDQSYDMISNVLKSLHSVMIGIANNT